MRDAFDEFAARTRLQRVRGEWICIARASTLRHEQKTLPVSARARRADIVAVGRPAGNHQVSIKGTAGLQESIFIRIGGSREEEGGGQLTTAGRRAATNDRCKYDRK